MSKATAPSIPELPVSLLTSGTIPCVGEVGPDGTIEFYNEEQFRPVERVWGPGSIKRKEIRKRHKRQAKVAERHAVNPHCAFCSRETVLTGKAKNRAALSQSGLLCCMGCKGNRVGMEVAHAE